MTGIIKIDTLVAAKSRGQFPDMYLPLGVQYFSDRDSAYLGFKIPTFPIYTSVRFLGIDLPVLSMQNKRSLGTAPYCKTLVHLSFIASLVLVHRLFWNFHYSVVAAHSPAQRP